MATRKILLLAASLLLVLTSLQAALADTGPPRCNNPTVVDGYIYYANGDPAEDASVAIQTSAPTCNNWTATTDANGYYVIPGLNIQSQTVNLSANVTVNEAAYSGINSYDASASILRLSTFIRPSSPTLTAVADRHNGTSVRFAWTSGTEPNGYPKQDQFAIYDDSFAVKTSPQTRTLAFGNYAWAVQTCTTSGICSAASEDSFQVYNTQPSAPVLTDINYTTIANPSLAWRSGIDNDTLPEDSLVDELQIATDSSFANLVFSYAYNATENALQAVTVSGVDPDFDVFFWRVRTCDNTSASNNCSNYSTSYFFRYSCAAGTTSCGGGGTSIVYQNVTGACPASVELSLTIPPSVSTNQDFAIVADIQRSLPTAKIFLSVAGLPDGVVIDSATVENLAAGAKVTKVLAGHVSDNVQGSVHELTLKINFDGEWLYKTFKLNILTPGMPVCGNNVCELGENAQDCLVDCYSVTALFFAGKGGGIVFWSLALTIILIVLAYYVRRKLKPKVARMVDKEYVDWRTRIINFLEGEDTRRGLRKQ